MVHQFLDQLPFWGVFLVSLLATYLGAQFGYFMGRRRYQRLAGADSVNMGPLVTSCLGLSAFMLAIVFSVVESRIGELRHVVLDEANAIGTAFLRADLAPPGDRDVIRQLLMDYVNLQVEAVRNPSVTPAELVTERAEKIQNDLWSIAVKVAREQPTPTFALFVASLNELIDFSAKRLILSVDYRIPGPVWLVLMGLIVLSVMMGGYDSGLSGSRHIIALTVAGVTSFSVVLTLVIFLDRPHHHLPESFEEPLFDLQETLRDSMQSTA